MSNRKLIILGTSSQVPTVKRNHLAFFLRWDNEGFLFDPGEGTQRQFILNNVSPSEITKIFISHFHGDHCLGLPGIIQRLSLDGVKHTITLFYPKRGELYLHNLLNCAVFYNRVLLHKIPIDGSGVIYEDEDLRILAYSLKHGIETYGFRIEEKDKRTILPYKLPEGIKREDIGKLKKRGFIEIEGKILKLEEVSRLKRGQKFAYIADTGFCDQALALAKDVDLLVCESTYIEAEKELARDYKHLTAKQAAQIAKEAGVKRLVLIHFSQRYRNLDDFLKEAKEIFENTLVSRDGDVIELPRIKRDMS